MIYNKVRPYLFDMQEYGKGEPHIIDWPIIKIRVLQKPGWCTTKGAMTAGAMVKLKNYQNSK